MNNLKKTLKSILLLALVAGFLSSCTKEAVDKEGIRDPEPPEPRTTANWNDVSKSIDKLDQTTKVALSKIQKRLKK